MATHRGRGSGSPGSGPAAGRTGDPHRGHQVSGYLNALTSVPATTDGASGILKIPRCDADMHSDFLLRIGFHHLYPKTLNAVTTTA